MTDLSAFLCILKISMIIRKKKKKKKHDWKIMHSVLTFWHFQGVAAQYQCAFYGDDRCPWEDIVNTGQSKKF